ncbi:hypothetical protein [Bifidobacterium longum]|uniref:hypothetical protein n=1 Tax=Bifidobacterium longum TaxID=216816 RepID=UPI0030EEFB80
MRNMNLAPQPRDLTALLNTNQPTTVNTEKTKERNTEGEEPWVKTSVSMRPETRRRLKTYAAEHDLRIQEVVEEALGQYLA